MSGAEETRLETARAWGERPIARWLNLDVAQDEAGLLYRLGFDERHIGNPAIRALHGGAISAFLETAAQAELAAGLDPDAVLRTVSFSIDFLASSRADDMIARARILRLGRRLAFLEAIGWQGDETRLVASARITVRIGSSSP